MSARRGASSRTRPPTARAAAWPLPTSTTTATPTCSSPTAEGTPDQLYENDGSGNFTEIAAAVGVADMAGNRVALWFDYDGDRRLDLIDRGRLLGVRGDAARIDVDAASCTGRSPTRSSQDVTVAAGIEERPGRQHDRPPRRRWRPATSTTTATWSSWSWELWSRSRARHVPQRHGDGTFIGDQPVALGRRTFANNEAHWQPIHVRLQRRRLAQDIYYAIDFTRQPASTMQPAGQHLASTDVAAWSGNTDNAWNDMGDGAGRLRQRR